MISLRKEKYDETYKIGNTTVHVVAPPPMTHEEKERILDEFHQAGYKIWQKICIEEKAKC